MLVVKQAEIISGTVVLQACFMITIIGLIWNVNYNLLYYTVSLIFVYNQYVSVVCRRKAKKNGN